MIRVTTTVIFAVFLSVTVFNIHAATLDVRASRIENLGNGLYGFTVGLVDLPESTGSDAVLFQDLIFTGNIQNMRVAFGHVRTRSEAEAAERFDPLYDIRLDSYWFDSTWQPAEIPGSVIIGHQNTPVFGASMVSTPGSNPPDGEPVAYIVSDANGIRYTGKVVKESTGLIDIAGSFAIPEPAITAVVLAGIVAGLRRRRWIA